MTEPDHTETETADLVANLQAATDHELPSGVIERAKELIADNVGVALAGSAQPAGRLVIDHVATAHPGDEATLLTGASSSAAGAALANGTLGGVLSYDDTFESMVIHPSSPVLPAALAATELVDGTGTDLLEGFVVGVEAAHRIGRSTHPSHYVEGWHSTGTIGTFGAAAAAATVLDLDRDQFRHAFGVAGSSAAGLRKNGGTMTFALHGGRAAEAGLRAARLARSGFTADPAVFDGELGYGTVTTATDGYEPAGLQGESDRFEGIEDVGLKAYPCARVPQAAMDGLTDLLAETGLESGDVAEVVVGLDESLEGILDRPEPTALGKARGSIEFCVGLVLARGRVTGSDVTQEALDSPDVRAAMANVQPTYDDLGAEFSKYGALVTVETTAGDRHTEAVHHAPGSPANPLGRDRLREKFLDAARAGGTDGADELFEYLLELDGLDSLGSLLDGL